jgi:hypothetical protein
MSSPLDFSRYNPPGVYVDPAASPPLLVTGIDPTVLCIIGRGVGFRTYTESVTFAQSDTVTLTKSGIDASSVTVVGSVTDPAQAGLTLQKTFEPDVQGTTHDYHLTVDSSAGVDESVTSITRSQGGAIETAHPVVRVTYRYTDADYHALHVFDDFDAITELYGPSFNPQTGDLASPLTLACQEAIVNGANYLYTIALSGVGSLQQQFNDAYNLLSGNFDANVIVPLFEGFTTTDGATGMLQAAMAWADTTLSDGHTRMMLCGFDKGWNPTISEVTQLTSQIAHKRVISVWPNKVNIYNGVTNQARLCDGFYLAAAIGGIMSRQPPQMPVTRKYPKGVMSIPAETLQTLTKSAKNQLASSGSMVVEADRRGRLVVRHGLTTNYAGGILEREISLVRAQDALYNLIQDTLVNAGLIGTVITATTPLNVKGIVSGALELAKNNELIFDYLNLKVRQQAAPSGDPTVIEVKFAYKPTFPLNYIVVSFSVDTSTGDINSSDVSDVSGNELLTSNPTP